MIISPELEKYRVVTGVMASRSGKPYGAFDHVRGPCGRELTIMADRGDKTGWDHVSVSTRKKSVPNWTEMCWVKDRFWEPEDWVVQFHPAKSKYVNNYSVVLHLWRPVRWPLPVPPSILVGVKELGTLA